LRTRHDRLAAVAAAELIAAVGDGVMVHPAHPRVAPRHGRTLAQPWLLTPCAVFNLAGLPVTEVPLGLSERGLPLGMQVAAGLDRDHVSIAVALDASLDLSIRWHGGDLGRLVNARHAALHEALAIRFVALPGWVLEPEVSFSVYGERGVVDGLAWHQATRTCSSSS